MTVVGVTGHLSIPESWHPWIVSRLRDVLRNQESPLVGVSCLALGADQIFAREVLALGGHLVAILPSERYEHSFAPHELADYHSLLSRASKVTTLDHDGPTPEAYLAAGEAVLAASDMLVAVWDGQPSRGRGGTADIVSRASVLGMQVVVVWPKVPLDVWTCSGRDPSPGDHRDCAT